jgi:DNA repair protein RecO (recombination protein O)
MSETRRGGSDRGFLLHAEPWRETSLLVDAWTRAHGRLWLVAKGAKRPHSALRSVLLPFQPLHLRWSGKGERLTLTGAGRSALVRVLSQRIDPAACAA